MVKENKRIVSVICVLIAGIMWGLIGLFVRKLNADGYESMDIVFIRSIAGTLLMMVFIFFYDRSLFKIRLKDIWCFIGTGVLSLTFFNLCYFMTISITSLSVAAILLYTAPSMVMIMSVVIFKEKMTIRKVLSVILAFVGCVFVTGVLEDTGSLSGKGILIGLGAGLGYALYSIFARFALNRGYKSLTVTLYTFIFSFVGSVFFSRPDEIIVRVSVKPAIILFMLLFGLISTALPYIFYTVGLSGMESGKASIIASIEPVTATLIGVLIFEETMSLSGAVGVLLVLLSIFIVNIGSDSRKTVSS